MDTSTSVHKSNLNNNHNRDEGSLEMDAKIENEKNNNLSEEWRQKAENELNETADIRKSRIKKLRHMLLAAAIPSGRRDDAFLLRFLRAKKFDVEKAFKMITKYYSMKEQSPELFKVSPASQLYDLLKMQIQYMVPNRDSNGRKLYIFRVKKCDPYKCAVETVFRTNVLALENAVREPETQIGGLIILLDMAGAGIGHAKFLAPHLARKTVEVVQEAFPLRFKAFHVLHEPFYFDAILAVLKPFLKEKIRRRIFTHGNNLSSLHEYISPDILPSEYGGNLPKFDNALWRTTLMNNEGYFQRLENFNCNFSNILEDSGIEIEENESQEINGNHLNETKFNDDEKTGIKTVKALTPTDVVMENNSTNTTVTSSIPLIESENTVAKTLISQYSSDDESEYEVCEDFPNTFIPVTILELEKKDELKSNDKISESDNKISSENVEQERV